MDQDQTPHNAQGLNGIRKGMGLISPGHIRRCHQHNRDPSVTWGWDEFVECPVLEHKAQSKHQDPQSPEHGDRGDISILTILEPKPLQEEHWQAIDGPEGKDAPDGVRGGEFPGDLDGITEDLAWREQVSGRASGHRRAQRGNTGDDLGALEVLIRMEIARRQSKIETDEHQEQIRAPPHGGLRVLAAWSREAQTRQRQGDGGHWQGMEEGIKEEQTEQKTTTTTTRGTDGRVQGQSKSGLS